MIEHAKIDLFYKSALSRTIRLLVCALLLLLCVAEFSSQQFPKYPLFFLSVFVMTEIFYHFHIARIVPRKKVADNSEDAKLSCTKQALELFLSSSSSFSLLRTLLRERRMGYFLSRLRIQKSQIRDFAATKEELLITAKELALRTGGVYITRLDFLCAYLLLSEKETKLLFTEEIKSEELILFLKLSRPTYDAAEYPGDHSIHFDGEGFGEALVTGWTPLTKQFTVDWTTQALWKKRYLFGREKEYKETIDAVTKKQGANALLVGEPGVGRSTLLVALVQDSFKGILPDGLNHKRVLELMTSSLLAGASDQGELSARLSAIIQEVSHAGDVILYIPEFQHVLGSSEMHLDISGTILPYLRDGRLPIVGTMSPGNYKMYLEKNPLAEEFTIINLQPPEKDVLLGMLLQRSMQIESEYHCIVTLKAIEEAVKHAHLYLPDQALPGSGVRLLSDAASQIAVKKGRGAVVEGGDVTALVEQKTNVPVGMPLAAEKDLLLHLEEHLHTRVIDQVAAISAIAEAMRRVRSGVVVSERPISFLFLGPTGVGKTETAKALADIYFHGEAHIIRLDMSEYADTDGIKRLLGAAPGQGDERGELTDKVHDTPYALVLLDEFEKANPRILDLFLQVLEDGRLTDNKGRTVSFDNTIIIATSNAASEYIREQIASGKKVDKVFHQDLLEHLQSQHLFKPELLNRFDEVITFTPLGPVEIAQITTLLLDEIIKRMQEQDITLSFSDDVVKKIGAEGYDPQFGARPLRRYIQTTVEDTIARLKLEDKLARGASARFVLEGSGTIGVVVS